MLNNVSPKMCRLRDKMEKYGTAGQTTDDNVARALCMLVSKATDTNWDYVILIVSPR
jgi:hypothetical protein